MYANILGILCALSSMNSTTLGKERVGMTRPRGYKTFSWSTQLSMKFLMLINVKMPTIVGILTFIRIINTTLNSLKAREVFIFETF